MKKRRLTRREKRSKRKRAIIISTLCLLFVMTAGYATFQTNLSITAKGNIKVPSRVIQSWDYTSQEDFHTDYYKEKIVSATFLDTNQVPNNATESWDVSEDGKGGVKAWVVPNTGDSTQYDLYIGANDGVIANENSNHIFSYFINLKMIEFNDNFDTSNVINMQAMFYNCISLINIDLSSFDTKNVTTMEAMFSMYTYRGTGSNLTEINLSGWNTSQVTNMRDIFAFNPKLKTIIGIENFNTNNVTTMQGLFIYNKSLISLDLSKWNTNNVTNMWQMFSNCTSLTELNLCNFNTSTVIDMRDMFYSTTNLTKIKVGPNWIIDNADTTSMFYNSGVSSVTIGQC